LGPGLDVAIVSGCDGFDDGKSEADTVIAVSPLVDSPKRFEERFDN
jgi:hypothetical protein